MAVADNEKSPLIPKHLPKGNVRSSRPLCQKITSLFSLITVEAAYFLYSTCYGLESVTLVNLWVDKECQHMYSMNICKVLDSGQYPKEQDTVQDKVSTYKSMYAQWIEYLPAVFVVLILGAWSDSRDRRLPVVLPFVGFLLKSLGILANCYWWSLPPKYLLFASVPVGLGGGIMALLLGSSAYVSAISRVETRTIRLAIIQLLYLAAVPFGKMIAAPVFTRYGYIGVFSLQALIIACTLLYALIRLEKHPGVETDSSPERKVSLCHILSPHRLLESVSVAWKKREGGARMHIIGHIIIIACLLFDVGTANFVFLYTRKKFAWDYYTFTTWSVLSTPVSGIGNAFVLPLLSYRYKVEDSIFGFMGSSSYMFTNIIQSTAPVGWVMYIAIGTSVFSGMTFAASRGALSKLVPKEELGAIFSVVALGETIMPLISGPVFTAVYNMTLEIYPGTVFAFAAVIFAFTSWLYAYVYPL
ncbi:hypothetical protein SK128_020747 [Halocaridina rubra]|uniref:Proton-coupled folate transporter n=1 Tax=Halocaridina rubra TaxID=373956 RepID=A0AAN9A2W0_HALRR